MQKLDFTWKIENVADSLNSTSIVDFFNSGIFSVPDRPSAQASFRLQGLDSYIIESAFHARKLKEDQEYAVIVEALGIDKVYSTENLGDLYRLLGHEFFSLMASPGELKRPLLNFYFLHSTISKLSELSRGLLLPPKLEVGTEEEIVILEIIVSGEESLGLNRVQRILKLLDDLNYNISTLLGVEMNDLSIELLDSGSSTNVGIEDQKGVARQIKKLLLELLDHVRFGKNRKFERNLSSMSEALKSIEDLEKRGKEAGISHENLEKAKETILHRAMDLIDEDVYPKEHFSEIRIESRRAQAIENRNRKLIEGKREIEE